MDKKNDNLQQIMAGASTEARAVAAVDRWKIRRLMTTLLRVKAEVLDEVASRPILLLGAAASIKSGCRSSADFAEMTARWAFLRDQGRTEHDQTVHRSDDGAAVPFAQPT